MIQGPWGPLFGKVRAKAKGTPQAKEVFKVAAWRHPTGLRTSNEASNNEASPAKQQRSAGGGGLVGRSTTGQHARPHRRPIVRLSQGEGLKTTAKGKKKGRVVGSENSEAGEAAAGDLVQ